MADKAAATRARRLKIKEALESKYEKQGVDDLKEIKAVLDMVIKGRIREGKKALKEKKRVEEAAQVIAQHKALIAAGVDSVFSDAMIRKANSIVKGPKMTPHKSPAKKTTKKKTSKKR